MINKIIIFTLSITLVLTGALLFLFNSKDDASAALAKDFNPGRIIDDVVFYNNGTMTVAQIQNFLNSKNPNCDTNGTGRATDWGRGDITRATLASYIRNGTNGYSRDTGFHTPPYTCLKDRRQNTPQMAAASGLCGGLAAKSNQSSAQIIKDVSDACGINPQVLIVLLEKEQSLVTDMWPLNRQFNSATGFACSDSAPCDSAFGGFFYQVYYAARQFKIYKAEHEDPVRNGRTTGYDYNYRSGQTNRIYWQTSMGEFINPTGNANDPSRNGRSGCGVSNVYIENQATAGLYIYTPYRPNQSAMNNLYGTGDGCSAYGNRNFWRIFTDWFGSTNYTVRGGIAIKYNQLGGATSNIGLPTSNEQCGLSQSGCKQLFEKGAIYWTRATDAQALWGGIRERWEATRAENGFLGYPTAGETVVPGGVYQQFQKGRIYWKSGIGAWSVHGGIGERYLQTGGHTGPLGYPISQESCGLSSAGCSQTFENGRIFWSSPSGAWDIVGEFYERWVGARADSGFLGYPTSSQISITGGKYQQFQKGRIYTETGSSIARSVHGGIGERYLQTGGHTGDLGIPQSNELCHSSGKCEQLYQNGRIVWSSRNGAWDLDNQIYTRWEATRAENGFLGYPTAGETVVPGGVYQQFQKGRIYWKSGIGAWSVHGGIGERYLQTGGHTGPLGYPISQESSTQDGATYQKYENGTIYWSSQRGTWVNS